jgi:Ca2+-binding EF-hand superfamily protein
MRAAWEEHLKESKDDLKKKFDKNGDGTIDETEKQAAELELRQKWQQRRQEILRRFDKDGDGVLNEEEKAAAKEARGAPRCEGGERPETGPKPQRPAPSP